VAGNRRAREKHGAVQDLESSETHTEWPSRQLTFLDHIHVIGSLVARDNLSYVVVDIAAEDGATWCVVIDIDIAVVVDDPLADWVIIGLSPGPVLYLTSCPTGPELETDGVGGSVCAGNKADAGAGAEARARGVGDGERDGVVTSKPTSGLVEATGASASTS